MGECRPTVWHDRMMRIVGQAKRYRREDALCRRYGTDIFTTNPVSDALFDLVSWGYLEWFDKGDEDAPLFYRLTPKGEKWRTTDNAGADHA